MRYTRTESLVEAEQYLEGKEIPVWLLVGIQDGDYGHGYLMGDDRLKVLIGQDTYVEVQYGDWVVRHPDGEFSVWTDEQFNETFTKCEV